MYATPARRGARKRPDEALAWRESGESIRILLNPVVDHGVIELSGTRAGNTITGQWTMTGDPATARGRFVLRRTR